MPKQTRSARSRRRTTTTARPAIATAPVADPTLPPAMPPAAARPAAPARATPLPGTVSRGFITDYSYVVGELKRIFVISAAIIALMVILWFIIG